MKKLSKKPTIFLMSATTLVLGMTAFYFSRNTKIDWTKILPKGQQSETKVASGTIQNSRTIGMRIQSKLELKQAGSFRFGSGESKGKALIDQKVESSFKGDLEEITFEDDGLIQKSFVAANDVSLAIQLNGKSSDQLTEKVRGDLAMGFVVLRDRSGLVKDVILAKEADDVSSDFIFALAKAMQYSFPEGVVRSDWNAMEEDTDGSYQAHYVAEEAADKSLHIRRDKVLYAKLTASIESTMGGNSLSSKTAGETKFVYDQVKNILVSAKSLETLDLFDESNQNIGQNAREYTYEFQAQNFLSADVLANLMVLTHERFSERKAYTEERLEANERQLRAMYETRLGQDNFESITRALADIDSMNDEESSIKAQTAWFLKARALIYLHPEELPRIQDLLRQAKVDSANFQIMTSALVNISSPEAQKILADLALERREDVKAMESLIPDLGFVSAPEPFIEETIRSLQKDEASRGMADLALATMGSQLAKDTRSESQSRLDNLVQELNQSLNSQDSEQLKHRLDMVGNLSSSESIPHLKEVLTNPDAELRAKAAFALRDMKVAEGETLLKTTISQDKDEDVRLSAATALQNYSPNEDLLQFLRESLSRETSEKVRIQLLIGIEKARFVDRDGVKQVLAQMSQQDPHEQVRNYAALLLTDFAGS